MKKSTIRRRVREFRYLLTLTRKARALRIGRKSNQTLESRRIEPGTSGSEGRALTN